MVGDHHSTRYWHEIQRESRSRARANSTSPNRGLRGGSSITGIVIELDAKGKVSCRIFSDAFCIGNCAKATDVGQLMIVYDVPIPFGTIVPRRSCVGRAGCRRGADAARNGLAGFVPSAEM
jgi:hypothetical protein